jgi:hypothetical protein
MKEMTKSEATLFMDGQTHYLRQVMRVVLGNDFSPSIIKSGGSS